jgi:hypothetical protein
MNIFGGHTREDYYLGYFEEGRDYWKIILEDKKKIRNQQLPDY